MSKIRVLLADDHETVRQALRLLLDGQHDIEVVGEAADGTTALQQAERLHPHLVVMDLTMPGMNGLTATRTIRAAHPDVKVIALTRHGDEAYVKELVRAGASGYVLKQSASTELLRAIRAVAGGQPYMDATIAARERDAYAPPRARSRPERPLITDREATVLRMMAVGHSNKEIASALHISVKTVEVHKANAMRKLDLRGRIDVVKYAILQGWLEDP